MRTKAKKLPVTLNDMELKKLISIPNKRYYTGQRNKAMIVAMANLGLRVSEVVNLKVDSIDLTNRKLRVVNGKYARDRDLKIGPGTAEALTAWDKRRKGGDYFFNTIKGGKLQTRYVQAMVARYAERAGIKKNVTPHTLRHTFATNFYRQTKDIQTLRNLLGHSDISTTQIYVTLANIDVENAMDSFREIVA
jgi:site-specific recombinase XerD